MVTPDEHRDRMRDEEFEKIQRENELKRLAIHRQDPENPLGWTERELQKRQQGQAEFEKWRSQQAVKETTPWYIQCIFWIMGLTLFFSCLTACKNCLGSH